MNMRNIRKKALRRVAEIGSKDNKLNNTIPNVTRLM